MFDTANDPSHGYVGLQMSSLYMPDQRREHLIHVEEREYVDLGTQSAERKGDVLNGGERFRRDHYFAKKRPCSFITWLEMIEPIDGRGIFQISFLESRLWADGEIGRPSSRL